MTFRRGIAWGLLLTCLVAWEGCSTRRKPEEGKREASYQATFKTYSEAFQPGMSRKEAENLLQSRGAKFTQMCCIDERTAQADLVIIGKEPHPWYCSEHNVYVAFQFAALEAQSSPGARDDDVLKRVTIFHWLEGCL